MVDTWKGSYNSNIRLGMPFVPEAGGVDYSETERCCQLWMTNRYPPSSDMDPYQTTFMAYTALMLSNLWYARRGSDGSQIDQTEKPVYGTGVMMVDYLG